MSGDTLRRLPQRLAATSSWVGLGAVAVSSVMLTSASVYPGALVAFPVLGAGLVIAGGAAEPEHGVEWLLRRKPFQWLGLISFSLYLWHWPILIIVTQHRGATTLPVWENLVLLVLAALAAIVTYRLLENPIRHSRALVQRRWASVVMGLCLIAGTLVVTTYEEQRPALSLGNLGTVASATAGSPCEPPSMQVVSGLRSEFDAQHPRTKQQSTQDEPVVEIGDSTSCTLLPGLEAVGPSYGLEFQDGAVIGCGVVSGEIAPYYNASGVNISDQTKICQSLANRIESQAIERYRPSVIVWGSTEEHGSIVDQTGSGSRVLDVGTSAWNSVMLQRMDDRVAEFLATGAKVILLSEPPPLHSGTSMDAIDVDYEHMNALLKEVAARHPHQVAVVNLAARVCPPGPPCPLVVAGPHPKPTSVGQAIAQGIRPDLLHYSTTSSLWVAKWLVPRIAAAARNLS